MLLFLGPDTGFRLIVTSTLDKLLFLPSFDEAQDKAIQIEDIMFRTKLDSAIEKFQNEELSN